MDNIRECRMGEPHLNRHDFSMTSIAITDGPMNTVQQNNGKPRQLTDDMKVH
jgi:hypothetical protein